MKRFKDSEIIPKIIDPKNIRRALNSVLTGTFSKSTSQGREILAHFDQFGDWLAAEIEAGEFRLTNMRVKEIVSSGKIRRLHMPRSYYEKAGVCAIMTIIEQVTRNRFIRSTGASIKHRGVHDLVKLMRQDIVNDPEGTQYAYSDDISKFYESVSQDMMMDVLRRMFKGKVTLTLLERFVRYIPTGLSIGLRSSQFFGNLLLSVTLDHFLKSENRVKYYYRYCDDKRVLASSKEECQRIERLIRSKVEEAGLSVKRNHRIFPVSEGVDFLGYKVYPDHTAVRKQLKKRAARKLKKVKSKTRRQVLIASFYSLCKHADAKHLFKKITGMSMSEYQELKSLADLGIKSTTGMRENGEKNFAVRKMSLSQLAGSTVCILDFQPNVSTKWSRKVYRDSVSSGDHDAKEKTKYLVLAQMVAPNRAQMIASNTSVRKGEKVKFFTGYPEMCSVCDQLKERDLLGKNKVVIAKNAVDNFVQYLFT